MTCIRSFLLVGVTLKFRPLSRSGMTVLSCSFSTRQSTPGCWVAGRRGSWSEMVPGGGGVECWELELVVVLVFSIAVIIVIAVGAEAEDLHLALYASETSWFIFWAIFLARCLKSTLVTLGPFHHWFQTS